MSQATYRVVSVPAPTGGLNVYDSLVGMPETDAVALENIVPQPYGCMVRKGYQEHSNGLVNQVNSLAVWSNTAGTKKFFGWAGTNQYDVTAIGTVGAPIVTSLTNSWWQSTSLANAAGVHLLSFNGADNPIWYSGAGTQRLSLGDGIVTGTWKNIDPSLLIQAVIHQRRVWAVEINSTRGWYLPPDQVFGVATVFDFGPLFKLGGFLSTLYTWTIDAGSGSDDHLVAISSMGEAAVYRGISPASSTTWSLVGVYNIGQPVSGRRYGDNVSGDLLLITQSGLVSMAAQVTSTQLNSESTKVLSNKVQALIGDAIKDLGALAGWALIYSPAINLLFMNIPGFYDGKPGQLVFNVVNQAWCTFSGLEAWSWLKTGDELYFGMAGGLVQRGWYGSRDGASPAGDGGDFIQTFTRQAYSYFGAHAVQKQVGMYRLNFVTRRKIGYNAILDYDFKQEIPSPPLPTPPLDSASRWNFSNWNVATWETSSRASTRSPWSPATITVPQLNWRQAEGIGTAVAITLRTITADDFTWVATDYTYRVGGPL